MGLRTLVISMLISRIVWLIWGSFTRALDNFMISVDFCREPVTLIIAFMTWVEILEHKNERNIPICWDSCVPMDPKRALLTDSRSFCLLLLTTSLASIRADLTSPLLASCFTDCRALLVATSSWNTDGQSLELSAAVSDPTCLISRSSWRPSERSFVCHALTLSSGVGPYRNRLIVCITNGVGRMDKLKLWWNFY